ncbi:hypothetical protein BDV96DRAFT_607972 [Lophiotrema nucula]|uniref:Cyanovirin-N domain-containing protein n=1 Tax=Lophiotrema nucula TaxID=690887 RepID=A0A6A5YF59_9PLEO|nr:hypothetical protein BDV96DRAFT_607972 [Lophiotrema nucula]
MHISSITLTAFGFLATLTSAALNGEEFWTNDKNGRFQACFHDGNDWYFCTGALAGTSTNYIAKLSLGDGYYVQFGSNGVANITADNGCFKAHCTPEYDGERGIKFCDVLRFNPTSSMLIAKLAVFELRVSLEICAVHLRSTCSVQDRPQGFMNSVRLCVLQHLFQLCISVRKQLNATIDSRVGSPILSAQHTAKAQLFQIEAIDFRVGEVICDECVSTQSARRIVDSQIR